MIVMGNWKMHKTGDEAEAFIRCLGELPVHLAVPATVLERAFLSAKGTAVSVGAQNMHDLEEGAYTGEISGPMLKSAGASFVLVGHSERRHVFGEDDAFVARKVQAALRCGLTPVLCVGETLQERERGQTNEVVEEQLKAFVSGVSMMVAYEPVWAIGTGKTALPRQVEEVHEFIRMRIEEASTPILYGGSVNVGNAETLFALPSVDGVLVGGASLQPESFKAIAKSARSEKV